MQWNRQGLVVFHLPSLTFQGLENLVHRQALQRLDHLSHLGSHQEVFGFRRRQNYYYCFTLAVVFDFQVKYRTFLD